MAGGAGSGWRQAWPPRPELPPCEKPTSPAHIVCAPILSDRAATSMGLVNNVCMFI